MKRKLFIAILAVVCALYCVFGLSACNDNYKLVFTEIDGGYEVTKTSRYIDKDIVIPSTYKGKPVISIGDYAFDSSGLTDITIPDSVTSIGRGAFAGCSRLASITIPDSVSSIGDGAFAGCLRLIIYCEAGNEPSGWAYDSYWRHIDWNKSDRPVVWDCKNNEVANDGNIYAIINGLRYALKDGYATVASHSFEMSYKKDITIPQSVVYKENSYTVISIGDHAFYDTRPKSIIIPDSITSIGDYAFEVCTTLKSIIIPDSVNSIGDNAFMGCSSLTSVTIGNSVTRIGRCAFIGCSSLTSAVFENPNGWWCSTSSSATSGTAITGLDNPATAAQYLRDKYDYDYDTYCGYYWKRT